MGPCIIVARFEAREGRAAEVDMLLRGFVGPSRAEDGCLFYDLHREVGDDHAFVILDGWRDKAAFEAHAASTHVAKSLAALGPLLARPPAIVELERVP